ncbi:hypothetical protein GY45DRAFT_773199 [Cubamyces sp. BRFM 1775]|nr:hypothetical protein GY45DRAFT_773199 [Cubamyces sp. BRFM 1775]
MVRAAPPPRTTHSRPLAARPKRMLSSERLSKRVHWHRGAGELCTRFETVVQVSWHAGRAGAAVMASRCLLGADRPRRRGIRSAGCSGTCRDARTTARMCDVAYHPRRVASMRSQAFRPRTPRGPRAQYVPFCAVWYQKRQRFTTRRASIPGVGRFSVVTRPRLFVLAG